MKTTVVNLRKEKYDIYIGRGSPFGNPFVMGVDGTREEVIRKYRMWWLKGETTLRRGCPPTANQIRKLRGKRLGCFCKPLACHGDVLVEIIEGR